jgi:hypothetical protein
MCVVPGRFVHSWTANPTFQPSLSVQLKSVRCDNTSLRHSYTCTMRPGIFRPLLFEEDVLSHTWRPPSSTCPVIWVSSLLWGEKNVDILSHDFLDTFIWLVGQQKCAFCHMIKKNTFMMSNRVSSKMRMLCHMIFGHTYYQQLGI